MKTKVTFASFLNVGEEDKYLFSFVESIRSNGKEYGFSPIYIAIDSDKINLISKEMIRFIEDQKVQILPVVLNHAYSHIPFFEKSISAGMVETHLRLTTEKLIWMDIDSVLLKFDALLLKQVPLMCRPVDIRNIGDPYDQPMNEFWDNIFQFCSVPKDKIFKIKSSVDQIDLKPYFNAGFLVVDPAFKILTTWAKNFKSFATHAIWHDFFQKDKKYIFFIHQAILAGTILNLLNEQEIEILPHTINYPLHFHDQYPEDNKISQVDELISFRLDTYLSKHDFSELSGTQSILNFLKSLSAKLSEKTD